MNKGISIIIPTYNEEAVISACIKSLYDQTVACEIIVVDDGSIDTTVGKIEALRMQYPQLVLLKQLHKGPGSARNEGAQHAKGDILVFVDADMTLTKNFIAVLTEPILKGDSRGTFTKSEFVSNWDNIWSRCWNFNQNLPDKRRIPDTYPDSAPVFRAIDAKEFTRVGGFTEGIGWTDDWSLSRKLGYQSTVTQAVCYHANPETLKDVYYHARWIGKNEFISGSTVRRLVNILRHSFPISLVIGLFKSIIYKSPHFVIFKIVYDTAIEHAIWESFFPHDKNK